MSGFEQASDSNPSRAFGGDRGDLPPAYMRAAVWTAALLWMGTACILNSRRCGRTHCRYTGPYYVAMIAPVITAGLRWPLSLFLADGSFVGRRNGRGGNSRNGL
jgi:hypothetical protein